MNKLTEAWHRARRIGYVSGQPFQGMRFRRSTLERWIRQNYPTWVSSRKARREDSQRWAKAEEETYFKDLEYDAKVEEYFGENADPEDFDNQDGDYDSYEVDYV